MKCLLSIALLLISMFTYAHSFECACGGTGTLYPVCSSCSHGSVTCHSCSGSGTKTERCYSCRGGYIDKEVQKRCTNCSYGKVTMTDTAPCGSCRNGQRPTMYNGQTVYQTCNICYGSGTKTVTRKATCPVCRGSGYSGTEIKKERCYSCTNGYKEVTCRICSGSGSVSCRRCGGSGRVSKPCPY